MATVVYKSLTALQPVELKYNYSKDETLQASTLGYSEGYNFFKLNGLDSFQDISINKSSCFALTTAISLSTIFINQTQLNIGTLPGTFKLQTRYSSIYYAGYNTSNNNFSFDSLYGTNLFILPVENNTEQVEIKVGQKYLQIDSSYPYTARLDNAITDTNQVYRQRFYCLYINGLILIKVYTGAGYRYLSYGNDNILRATGLILNDSTINDYLLKAVQITPNSFNYNFNPFNNWVTYFFDFPEQINNKSLAVNKEFKNNSVNFLLDFPIEQAIKTGEATFNIANLKTNFTPAGGPSPVDNSYNETVTTTN